MIRAIQSEILKLVTLRFPYVVVIIMSVVAIIVGYAVGAMSAPGPGMITETILSSAIQTTLWFHVTVLSIVAVLIVTSEYRYGTMGGTLVTVNNRLNVFASKAVTAVVFGLASGLILALIAAVGGLMGAGAAGVDVTAQSLEIGRLILHEGMHLIAFALIGVSFGFIFKGAVVPLLIIMGLPTVEFVTKMIPQFSEMSSYLPFTALQSLATFESQASVIMTALVYCIAIVGTGVMLFIVRDA